MLRARYSFFAQSRYVALGELVPESDPIVRGREPLFERIDGPTDEPPIERATAAPGEKRTTTKRPTRRAKPKD